MTSKQELPTLITPTRSNDRVVYDVARTSFIALIYDKGIKLTAEQAGELCRRAPPPCSHHGPAKVKAAEKLYSKRGK